MFSDAYPARGAGVITQKVEGTLVLLHLESGEYYSLDETGESIWELCDGAHSVGMISSKLGTEYGVAAEQLGTDVSELLMDLAKEGLIVQNASPTCFESNPRRT